jgi:hypothetical protein
MISGDRYALNFDQPPWLAQRALQAQPITYRNAAAFIDIDQGEQLIPAQRGGPPTQSTLSQPDLGQGISILEH